MFLLLPYSQFFPSRTRKKILGDRANQEFIRRNINLTIKNLFYLKNLLGVQLCFGRYSIDGCSGKSWSKWADQKCHTVSLDICQHNNSTKLLNLFLHHQFILDRRCQYLSGDCNVEDRDGGGENNIFEDPELEELLAEDSCQAQEELVESL